MTTYMEIVNKVIKRTNEVQVDQTTFDNVIGVQAAIKDSIIDSIDKIIQKKYKWPFLATATTQVLTSLDQFYEWPDDFLSVDWNSFYVEKNSGFNTATRRLEVIEREEWFRYRRQMDYDYETGGGNMPEYVFSDSGMGFGLTPSPDRAYTVGYTYYRNSERPTAFDDVVPIPKEYEYLLVAGGLMHMYLFYDNNERAQIAKSDFDEGLKDMVMTLIGNNFEHVYAGVVTRKRQDAFFW